MLSFAEGDGFLKVVLEMNALQVVKVILLLFLTAIVVSGCVPNNPYPSSERGKNIYYSTFGAEPKHLDPAMSYTMGEYVFLSQIYEPPLAYHYLKRPYELVPLTAERVPVPSYFDAEGNALALDAAEDLVAKAAYDIRIKPGIMYQEHPCFAKDERGDFFYHQLSEDDMDGIYEVRHFARTGTRELVAEDYVYQIKRLADPTVGCPILSTVEQYILRMREYAEALEKDLAAEREKRRAAAGAAYNQELDERRNPIKLDLDAHPFPGVEVVDRYTYRIILGTKYPQIAYWLAMPFFSPVPWEAVAFYSRGVLRDRNITLDRFPVGTGPYKIDVYKPHKEIILSRNENFREEYYPTEGEPGDEAMGLLQDSGKRIPFVDRAIYKLEKEHIPRWNKFLQGYYDASSIPSDTFDRAIQFTDQGDPEASQLIRDRNIRLLTSAEASSFYLAFNMLDDVVGGYTEDKRRLRQAISIAFDNEEYIQIFNNGRGIPSHSPIPPGIFGYEEGESGINTYVYNWDAESGPVRKSLDEARRLLAEAGYPGGKDKEGRPLIVGFDNYWTRSAYIPTLSWMRKKLEAIGITMDIRTTDYNRFQDKARSGNFQILFWGWIADYPDPENFLFLLYGPNSKAKYDGENAANYDDPEYNHLFEQMRSMENSPERLAIIRQMKRILQRDAPWVFIYHEVDFGLYHEWTRNVKPSGLASASLKYRRVEASTRERSRREWNRPVIWPVLLFVGFLVLGSVPAVITAWRRERGKG